MDRPTFSQNWSRVSRLTPVLRPQVQIHRQLYRGEPWFVVHDSVSNSFFRLNPVAYHLVGLLDSKRTVDEVWRLTLDRYGDMAPTQDEVIGLLAQLNESNLMRVDLPSDAEPLLRRNRKRKLQHWGGQAMSLLFLRIPLFNPDQLLKWLTPLFRPVLSKWGLMAWLVWIIYAAWQFLPHLRVFLRDAHSVLSPANWGWMVVLFVVIKTCHELGHGLVCKRFGGAVPEVGIMILITFPFPYVDATSSWNFPSKWKRLLVGGAGMIFELAIAAGAALIWLRAEPGSLTSQLSYNVVFMASVATVLFNANPLLRFDGYYMLSDLLEVPNMYQRSTQHLQRIVQRYAYGMRNVQPVSTRRAEQTMLLIYGIGSQIYRVLILVGILLFIAGQFFVIGLLLAAWSLITWAMVPLGKFIHWLVTSPALHENRYRAVAVTTVFLACVVGAIGLVPVPDNRRAVGVIESGIRANIVIQTDGFVTQVLAEEGQFVRQGQPILIAQNPQLTAQYKDRYAQLQQLRVAYRQALVQDPVQRQAIHAQINTVNEELAYLQNRLDDLVLHSPQDGHLVGHILKQWVGQYVKRGQVFAQVVHMDTLHVTALLDQAQNRSLFDADNPIRQVQLRTAGSLTRVLPSQLLKVFPSGRSVLPHPALGFSGGGSIATNPDESQGQTTTRPQFEVWLSLPSSPSDAGSPLAYPGQRVYVRFTMEHNKPLLTLWIHRLRQVLRERLSV